MNLNKKTLVEAVVMNQEFIDLIEGEIGDLVKPIEIDWENDEIRFFGAKNSHKVSISSVSDFLKNNVGH